MNVIFKNQFNVGADIKNQQGETVLRVPSATHHDDDLFLVMEVHPDKDELLVISRPFHDGEPVGPWKTEGTFEGATVDPDCPHGCGWTVSACNC